MRIFVVSQKYLDLSVAEVRALYKHRVLEQHQHHIIVDGRSTRYRRLAFTKEVYKILFACRVSQLRENILDHRWSTVVGKTFKVESDVEKKLVRSLVCKKLKRAKVNLENPDTVIRFIQIGKTVYATLLQWKNKENFAARKPQHRPGTYPASLDPQLARCMVNLSGIVGKGTVIADPFCGTGGILLEAALLGHGAWGCDNNTWMLKKCRKNVSHYSLTKKIRFVYGDATQFFKRCSAIITEPPFGKNTKSADLSSLYKAFLLNAARSTSNIVMSFPHWVKWKPLVRKSGWRVDATFALYVHKSMTRHIVILSRRD